MQPDRVTQWPAERSADVDALARQRRVSFSVAAGASEDAAERYRRIHPKPSTKGYFRRATNVLSFRGLSNPEGPTDPKENDVCYAWDGVIPDANRFRDVASSPLSAKKGMPAKGGRT